MTTLKGSYFKEQVLPHILSIIAFSLILAVYFNSAFFEGETLLQNDVLQGIAAGHESDEFREKTGEEALWSNSMFGGMPLYLTNIVFSGDWLTKIRYISDIFPDPANTVFLNFICFYILLSIVRVRPFIAFLGAFVYAFGSYNIISLEAGHIWKVRAISFIPLVFAGVILVLRKRWIIGFGLTALAVSLELGAFHYQITYYSFLLLLIFMINELVFIIKDKNYSYLFKLVSVLVVAAIIGVGTSFGKLWTTYEYSKYSIRGQSELTSKGEENQSGGLDRDYAFAWSYGKAESLTFLVPNLFGGASNTELGKESETYKALRQQGVPLNNIKQFTSSAPTYWGDQPFTSGPVYTGIITVFLFVLGMFILKPREKYWALAAVIFSFFLAWGNNFEWFNYFMFDYFPLYNKFRAVSMALVIALFCFPFIASIALNRAIDEKEKFQLKNLWKAGGIVVGLLVLIFIFSGAPDYASQVDQQLPPWLIDALRADRKSMLIRDTFRSLFFVTAGIALTYFLLKNKLSKVYFLGGLTLLTVVDLYALDKRYLNADNFSDQTIKNYFEPTRADKIILQDTAISYRVFNTQGAFQDARTSYFHKSIGGYHGAKMRRYQDVIEHHLSKSNMDVINMLNTKYFITGNEQNPVQRNPNALGNAWLVRKLEPVASPDEEIAALSDFNPGQTAFVDTSKFAVSDFTYDSSGTITLTEYQPNYLKYKYENNQESFAVFSEIYYPEGWEVFVDGEESEHIRVNYILRGMPLPPGEHVVEFRFHPPAYFIGNKVMWISSAIVALAFVAGLIVAGRREVKRVKEDNTN